MPAAAAAAGAGGGGTKAGGGSKVETETEIDWAKELLYLTRISLERLSAGSRGTSSSSSSAASASAAAGSLPKVHLLRVPKASSTALSTVARRLAGA